MSPYSDTTSNYSTTDPNYDSSWDSDVVYDLKLAMEENSALRAHQLTLYANLKDMDELHQKLVRKHESRLQIIQDLKDEKENAEVDMREAQGDLAFFQSRVQEDFGHISRDMDVLRNRIDQQMGR